MVTGFDYHPRTRIVFGVDSVDRLGELARGLDARHALLVTDPGIIAAGHVDRACRSLEAAGIAVTVFGSVRENPTTLDVDHCLEAARSVPVDLFIGLGGGSSIDAAKGCNFLLTNGGRMQDYWGTGKATKPMLPLIAVPTTAGTGSECQSFALISDEETHEKMACGDPKAAPRIALLDPTLTLSQPPSVTACTGIDALAHAVESAVTRKRNELSLLYAREAFQLILTHFPRVLEGPSDLEARAAMQLGAAWAGIAIENSMLGAAHSTANPLTARFGVVHGHAVGMMLPHVVRFNAAEPTAAETYRELAIRGGLSGPRAPASEAADALAGRLESYLGAAGLPASLSESGIGADDIPALAAMAAGQWTARYNPREVSQTDFDALYHRALPRTGPSALTRKLPPDGAV
jgi:alcohol dehydrogenase